MLHATLSFSMAKQSMTFWNPSSRERSSRLQALHFLRTETYPRTKAELADMVSRAR